MRVYKILSLTSFFVIQEGVNTEKLPAKGKVMVAGNLQKTADKKQRKILKVKTKTIFYLFKIWSFFII